ncbi:8226_t:CDS:2 [Diversispora eburnea]|uniref:8226_t:CDS:1 n=2 Tax=Diversisporales TaxID=214509 RepID=A0A9N8ZPL0_9GLOM|nr:8226_t:CDS:2 [Diversispora eburnea]
MATKISTELLIMILNNIQSTQDLYSSLLVNRIWCKVTIPILWRLPFGQEYFKELRKKKALCIRSYISCMDVQARTLLIKNGFDLSLSPPQATFDYPSFTHKFIINNLTCKLIINRCSFLDYFKLARVPENFSKIFLNYSGLIGSILNLPGASKVFKKLEGFALKIKNYEPICPLYESLTLICDNILNMDLKLSSNNSVELLAKLIGVQKRLENLSISARHVDCGLLLWNIISQKETLKSLHLYSVMYPQEFIKKILETASTNLRNIRLELNNTTTFDIFSPISSYCTKITELALLNLSSEQVIAVFNNNFNELRIFSSDCGKESDANELLCKMAENVPESLETIEIRMRSFSSDSLRNFFEGWCCEGLNIHPESYLAITSDTILNYCPKVTKLTSLTLNIERIMAIEYGFRYKHFNWFGFFPLFAIEHIRDGTIKNNNISDKVVENIISYGASKVFKKLESFTLLIEEPEDIYPLYEFLKLICFYELINRDGLHRSVRVSLASSFTRLSSFSFIHTYDDDEHPK